MTPTDTSPANHVGTVAQAAPFHRLRLSDPIRWLRLGWEDYRRVPLVGLFYGGCFVLMGWMLERLFVSHPAWMLALAAGFLLVGPFLCLGLYDASRRLERDEPVRLASTLMAWQGSFATLAIFGGTLLVVEMLWARSAMVVFAVSFNGLNPYPGTVLGLLSARYAGFVLAYLGVGAMFAGLIYAIGAVSMPMILDRGSDAITAALTSIRLIVAQPAPMLTWALVVALLVGVSMLPWFTGLLLTGPWVGFATWHAYRSAIAPPNSSGPSPRITE